MDLIITILPVVTEDLPVSLRFTPYDFLSRCKFSTLTTRQPMVEFYLLTFPRFPLRKKEHKSYFGKNRIHDFRISRCAGYLLDHSGDELILRKAHGSALQCFSLIFSTSHVTRIKCYSPPAWLRAHWQLKSFMTLLESSPHPADRRMHISSSRDACTNA